MSREPAGAKRPQRARGKLRVAALLDAAAALFAERGYEATTMTEIAARAGASIGSLYQFFPSKEALAETLFERYTERTGLAIRGLSARTRGKTPEQLAELLVRLVLELRSDQAVAHALTHAIAGSLERRKPLREAVRKQIMSTLRTTNPELSAGRASAAALVITRVLVLVPVLAAEQVGRSTALVDAVREMLAGYIGGLTATGGRSRRKR